MDLVTIKDLLGHAQIHTTADIYSHVGLRMRRKAIESISDALAAEVDDDDDERDGDGEPDDPGMLVPA